MIAVKSFLSRKQWYLTVVLLMAAAFAGSMASSGISLLTHAQAQRAATNVKPAVHRWEYQVFVEASPGDLADRANKLAGDGWELTQVITEERLVHRYIGHFRRPK